MEGAQILMSTAQIVRKSFNGGEITPELHYRSDLEKYHNSCKAMKNVMVTPWGAALRRPPTEQLHKFDTSTYGVPVKYLPFRFSLTEVFNIVFTDGSGIESADPTTADLIVLDDQGMLQVLEGSGTMILSTPYDPPDLDKLHHIQVNDFIYMTFGGLYPEYYILRYFDDTQTANRWRIEENELTSGPFEDENTESSITCLLNAREYDASETYSIGDSVRSGQELTITGAQWVEYGNSERDRYNLTVEIPGNTLQKEESISIFGITVSDSGNLYGMDTSEEEPVVNNPDGPYIIVSVEGDWVKLNYRIRCRTKANQPTPSLTVSAAGAVVGESASIFYESIQNNNINNPVTDPLWWQPVDLISDYVQINSSSDIFTLSDVGRLFKIQTRNENRLNNAWSADTVGEPFVANGLVTLKTEGGAWGGLLELQKSLDSAQTWATIGSIRSINASSNGSIEREVSEPNALLRVKLSSWQDPTGTYDVKACTWFVTTSLPSYSFFRIFVYVSSSKVIAECITPLLRPIQEYFWSLGAFSETTGYPNTLTIHEERKVYGGTRSKPNTVWGSRLNDFNNFLSGDLDVSPYTFTIKSDSFDTIRWMRSARQLMVGTEKSESIISGTRDESGVISPVNIDVRTQTYFGSSNIQAVVTADLVYFVQGQNKRVRSSQYDFGTDQYLSDEISILAKHITESGIKEMSYRRHPFNSIFFVLNNGRAVSFTYERENMVRGWSRIELTNGEFVSAASNYSDKGDIVAGIVKRGPDYFLEKIGTTDAGTVFLDSQVRFVDQDYSAGVSVPWGTGAGLTVIHNDVELAEGVDYMITGGMLTIPAHTDGTVTVGYKFDWCVEPTDFAEFGDFGPTKRASKISLYLINSGGCRIEINGDDAPFKEGASLSANELLNGRYELTCGGGYNHAISIKLSGDSHKPFCLSAIGMYATKR